jgi:2-amino-4-hydroxy-6-hydroxymethyldihydropteridine diphosphokinase
VSPLYETAPVGGPPQDRYLNAVVVLDTHLRATPLLERCLAIERERGRVRAARWGPRTLDLDVLIVGDETIDRPGLVVPHPRMTERRFVMEPLAKVWRGPLPDGRDPAAVTASLGDQEVRRVAGPGWVRRGPSPALLFLGILVAVAAVWWLRRASTRP